MEYRQEIDGLRALAVVPVVLFHAGFQAFSGGYVGVDIFFVVSGYLITSIILAEKQAGTFTLSNFYERRARRILPALFAMMFVCMPFAWVWMVPGDMDGFSQSLAAVPLFISNIFFWSESGYFAQAAELKPLLHTWSLAVEEQYYLLFPLFLLLTWRLGKGTLLLLFTLLALAGLGLAEWLSSYNRTTAFFLLPTRGWEILLGVLVAFHFNRPVSPTPPTHRQSANQIVSAMGLLLIVYAVFVFDKATPFPSFHTLIPTIGAALIILFATPQTMVGRLLGSRLLAGMGLISYSVYLWHQPLLAFTRYISLDEPSTALLSTAAIVAVVLGYFSWKYVETPFRNRQRHSRRQVFRYGAICSAFFIAFGVAGSSTTGFSYRYSEGDRTLAEIRPSAMGKYVERRFNEIRTRDFDAKSGLLKTLVIGDSNAQDLVNALYEAGFTKNIQISTRHIPYQCGNLFIERSAFVHKIADADMRLCRNYGLHEDARLRQLMREADEIWFASGWQYWQAELMGRSIVNLKNYIGKKVIVFGPKDFGAYNIRELLGKSGVDRLSMKRMIREDVMKTNALLKSELNSDEFIDAESVLCGEDVEEIKACALFTRKGELISHDGVHLTVSGAKYYGEKLAQHGLLSHLHK